MSAEIHRRQLLKGAVGIGLTAGLGGWPTLAQAVTGISGADLGPAAPFSFTALQARAEALARGPFVKVVVPSPDTLNAIDYDEYQKIRFKPDKSMKLDTDGRMPVQFFHLGKYATEPVRMHVVEDGQSREIIYSPSLFDIPDGHPAKAL